MNLKKILNPPMFQGDLKKKQYFEGWYFKLIDQKEENFYAFIPGVSLDKKNKSSHCFIQMLDGRTGEPFYFEYPLREFWASSEDFEVRIGKSYFSLNKIEIHIHQDGHDVDGELHFKNIQPWPKSLLAPGVMGFFTFIPIMECYHGMLSMNHNIVGKLTINNREIDFTNGLGYIEKDWGKSFPSGYIWIQTNHFETEPISFMASIAKIPFLGMHFTGFLIVLWYKGKIYTFTTYTGAKIHSLKIDPNRVRAVIADRKHIVVFDAKKIHDKGRKAPIEEAGVLKSPTLGEMKGRIMESLTSEVKLAFYKRGKRNKLLFKDKGHHAGLEIEAKLEDLDF